MKTWLLVIFPTLLIGISTTSAVYRPARAFAQQPVAKGNSAAIVQAGAQVFLDKCFQCHSVNKGEVRVGPSLFGIMKGPKAKTAAQIRVQLHDGKGKMPPFKDILTPQQVDQVIAYLHTL
jgi:mono/diheme cytochrome c family protein